MAIYVPPSLRHNRKVNTASVYTVHIYERDAEHGMHLYDAEITMANSQLSSKINRKLVYSYTKTSEIAMNLKHLTYYMQWKFGGTGARIETYNNTYNNTYSFIGIANDLDWVVSIIEVELDYHIGDKKCLLPKNKEKLGEYSRSRLSGYGKKFCDENRISQSRLAWIMCSPIRTTKV